MDPQKNTTPVARVERVYPSADVLPSNSAADLHLLLRADEPRRGGQRIHLLETSGKELRAEFLPGEELWDPDGQRLTHDVRSRPHQARPDVEREDGAADRRRRSATRWSIDREWPDAHGVPMVEGFRKTFRGGPAVRDAARSESVARDAAARRHQPIRSSSTSTGR